VTRTESLRGVLGLCLYFMRNLAYYDSGRRGRSLRIKTLFWSTIGDNFYDLCVLEWCKLFADPKDSLECIPADYLEVPDAPEASVGPAIPKSSSIDAAIRARCVSLIGVTSNRCNSFSRSRSPRETNCRLN
jgi:hypothetical protein